jgi:hypothetical protein
VTIVVQDHPLIEEPVVLDMSREEADSMDVETEEFVIIDIVVDDERRERVVMKQAAFDNMFRTTSVDEALSGAAKYWKAGRGRVGVEDKAKVNYRELPNAGIPHRGKVTDEEAAVVRSNLDEVNRNREAAGYAPIDPNSQRDAERYGFSRTEPPRPTPAVRP